MKKLILASFLACMSLLAMGQSSPEQIVKNFFQDYATKTPQETLENLYAHMPSANRVGDAIDKLRAQFGGLKDLVGAYIGYDLITKKDLVDRFSIYTCLVRYERQPVRFTFQFYRPKDQWVVYGFSYDDSFGDELEEATKIYNLKSEK